MTNKMENEVLEEYLDKLTEGIDENFSKTTKHLNFFLVWNLILTVAVSILIGIIL